MIRRKLLGNCLRGGQVRRRVDHLMGTPLLLVLGLLRQRRRPPQKINSVGILSCSTIGDTVIVSAIARDLKVAFPGCRITVFISSSASSVSGLLEGFDEEIILPITRPAEA